MPNNFWPRVGNFGFTGGTNPAKPFPATRGGSFFPNAEYPEPPDLFDSLRRFFGDTGKPPQINFRDIARGYLGDRFSPDTIMGRSRAEGDLLGKKLADMISRNPTLQMSGNVQAWLQGATAPVNWDRVNAANLTNPMQVIEGYREVAQQQMRDLMNQAAAKLAATGMGTSSPYQERLGGVAGDVSKQLTDIANRYLFEAAKERQEAELRAAMANQQAGLTAADIERRAKLQAAGIGSEYDLEKAREALQRELARQRGLEAGYQLGGQLAGESYRTLADLAGREMQGRLAEQDMLRSLAERLMGEEGATFRTQLGETGADYRARLASMMDFLRAILAGGGETPTFAPPTE